MLITVAGLLAASQLPIARFPYIVFPVIAASIDVLGRPREAVDRDLTIPVEARLFRLGYRSAVMSMATDRGSLVTGPFNVELSLNQAETRVRHALAGLPVPTGGRVRSGGSI